jgi:hypothetical protein
MKILPANVSLALSQVAHTVGDLWALYARLAAVATAETLSVDHVVLASRVALDDLTLLRKGLVEVLVSLPASSSSSPPTEDLELSPLEFCRASVECVLTDCLEPAISTLTFATTGEPLGSAEEGRSLLECVLADDLCPAISELSFGLLLDDEVSADAWMA